jgi:NAD(P) transhydrogenase subunit alpha
MKLGIRKEAASGEARVSATPASVASLVELGFEVAVVSGAGALSGLTDQAFEDAGAHIVSSLDDAAPLDLVCTVGPVEPSDIDSLGEDARLACVHKE